MSWFSLPKRMCDDLGHDFSIQWSDGPCKLGLACSRCGKRATTVEKHDFRQGEPLVVKRQSVSTFSDPGGHSTTGLVVESEVALVRCATCGELRET